jgi:TonB family protein
MFFRGIRLKLPGCLALALAGALVWAIEASAQQPTPAAGTTPDSSAQPAAPQQPASPQAAPDQAAPAQQPAAPEPQASKKSGNSEEADKAEPAGGITEDELKKMLVGKPLFLRGGYLFDSLSFNEHGVLIGHSPHASYTLCGVQVEKVQLSKHKVELIGSRYGLHFLGALPYEDPTKAVDRVKITPKKKELRITIDRELVVKPKKVKEAKGKAKQKPGSNKGVSPVAAPASNAQAAAQPVPPASAPEATPETADAEAAKKEMAAAPETERPADPTSVTTTTSPAHATILLKQALDNIFAERLDDRMIAAMPDFWKLYYKAAADKSDYQPADPTVMRQTSVDQKARLLTKFEPTSNEYAQDNGVAGMCLYHVVVGADGKPGEIAVARPIGFGLDENAVDAIRTATFEPAKKDGKPVPVMLDLVVQFRIYSKRTAVTGLPGDANQASAPATPGPYSVQKQ